METGGNTRVTYLQASWVCFCSSRPYRKSASFLRYLEWISVHIRSPSVNGWLGRNCILNILGHQPVCLNLQRQTMRSHWMFLTEKQEGTRVRQWGARENFKEILSSSDFKSQQMAHLYRSSRNFMECTDPKEHWPLCELLLCPNYGWPSL